MSWDTNYNMSFTDWPLDANGVINLSTSNSTATDEPLVSDGSDNYAADSNPMIQPLDMNQDYRYGYSQHAVQPIDEKMVEQMVERVLIERMKADNDKGPEDLIFLMKTCGFQKEMIDIVRKALRRDWQVTKEPQERLESLIYDGE